MKEPIFTGVGTALVTPFTCDSVDYTALRQLVDRQLEGGVDALIVCGTTGEAATMSGAERLRTIETVARQVDGRVPVIAGTGSNSTESVIAHSRDAVLAGADALLVVTPFYNKATQEGLRRHYTAIADLAPRPVIVYNVPSRTGVACTAETYAALAAHPNILGVKEASGDLALVQRTRTLCPEDFFIWSGNDDETAAIMLLGGVGVISVVSNLLPRSMGELAHLCLEGRFREAGQRQLALRELCEALFWEVNPIPVKTALAEMGLCQGHLRLPLCEMGGEDRARLRAVLERYDLIA